MEAQKSFEDWLQGLSQENKNEIAPPRGIIEEGSRYQEVMLKKHWESQK